MIIIYNIDALFSQVKTFIVSDPVALGFALSGAR
jgi:hypothetical protein